MSHLSRSPFRRVWLFRVWAVASLIMLALSLAAVDAAFPGMNKALPALRSGHAALTTGMEATAPAAVAARTALADWNAAWLAEESPIRSGNRAAYTAIEAAMGDAAYYLAADSFDPAEARTALAALLAAAEPVCGAAPLATASPTGGASPSATVSPSSASGPVTYANVLARAEVARDAAQAGDLVTARTALADVRTAWPDVEGRVATADGAAYQDIEGLLARAAAQLKAGDAGAPATLIALTERMAPFAGAATYTWMDPFLILVREGLEALLVVAALLAWLRPTDASDALVVARARRWVWSGAVAGVALSLALAVVVQALFQQLVTGSRRELAEGLIGLVAAVLLVWVAWWLHRQAALMAWSGYLKQRIRAFAGGGRRWALAGLAFLAVLREGAETVLFLLGMAPSISGADLALGLAIGGGVLLVAGGVVLGLGVRLPARPLFTALSLLLALMAFKFTGSGIGALQVAGWCEATVVTWWPDLPLLALFPTREAILAQSALALIFAILWWCTRVPQSAPQAEATAGPATDPA